MNGESNGGVWKFLTSFLSGVVLTGIFAYFGAQKDWIARREFNEENERYERHLEANDKQIGELIHALAQTDNDVARITEDLRISGHPVPPRR